MKKFIGIALLSFVLLISACTPNIKKEHPIGIEPITYEQLKEKISKKIDFIVYIGRGDCATCKIFFDGIQSYMDENPEMGFYYFSTEELRDATRGDQATAEAKAQYQTIRDELKFIWTPTFHHIVDGEYVSTFQFLDEKYYEASDEATKKIMVDEAITNFIAWYAESNK